MTNYNLQDFKTWLNQDPIRLRGLTEAELETAIKEIHGQRERHLTMEDMVKDSATEQEFVTKFLIPGLDSKILTLWKIIYQFMTEREREREREQKERPKEVLQDWKDRDNN